MEGSFLEIDKKVRENGSYGTIIDTQLDVPTEYCVRCLRFLSGGEDKSTWPQDEPQYEKICLYRVRCAS